MKQKIVFLLCIFVMTGFSYAQDKRELTVYTYDSFASEWGPGPKLKELFERQCDCQLNFVALDNSLGVLGRLKLEAQNSPADVVVGLDMNTLSIAKQTNLFTTHALELGDLNLPEKWNDDTFIPFDYGYFAFIYDANKLTNPPQSFEDLLDNETLKLVIQDPRSSTPGLGLLLWIKSLYGDQADQIWRKLSTSIITITPGWSEAYGLFLKGEADMVLSYTTSPAYHMIVEEKENYKAAEFNQGHYIQIETAAMLKHSKHPELARAFLKFLISEKAQTEIPTGNWMYPVALNSEQWPSAFKKLISPTKTLMIDPTKIAENKAVWTEEFVNSVSQ